MCPLTGFWLLFDMYSHGVFYFVTSPAPGQSSSFYKSHTSNNLVTDENPPLSPQLKSRGEEREREGTSNYGGEWHHNIQAQKAQLTSHPISSQLTIHSIESPRLKEAQF